MLKLTRLSGGEFLLNPELIEVVENTPDTVVVLTTGRKLLVRETAEQIVRMFEDYQRAKGRKAFRAGGGKV